VRRDEPAASTATGDALALLQKVIEEKP